MNIANRPGLLGAVVTLGVVLALAAVVTTSNTPVHATNSGPDLVVGTPSVDDATLYTGNQFALSVTVTNSGDGASEATRLRGYRSTDSTITTSDTEEGSQTVSALAAAGSSSFDHGLTAPSEAGTYYYGVCVDSVTDESDTTNNCSSSVAVTVSEPVPDLVVIGIDATDNIVTGGSFRVGVTVTNQGDAQSAATTLRWKQEVDGTTTEIGTSAQRALTRPQGSFKTIRLTAPSTPGTSYYWACVDSVAGESDTTNNCSSSVAVTVSEPVPDLVVIGIDATDNIVTGGSFRVGVTVTNQGDAQSAATTLRWKQEVDGTTTEIGTSAQRALTRPQGSFKTIRLTAPSTPGTSYYWACVDSVAGESDTTNNCSSSVTVTLTNNLATGAPTMTGTAQVGQTLTASTTGVSDSGGLTNATYTYQWLTDDTEVSGATSSTYTLVAADVGKAIKVRVSFTDDAGNEESLTSAATSTVTARPNPVTATIHNAPVSHDGNSAFTFELHFSEAFSISYKTLRDHAFTVTGGEVVKARRLEKGKNVRWEITVLPSSNREVTVSLPITTDCDDDGAVCTGDGRKLSSAVTFTVSVQNFAATGAPAISGTARVGETLTADNSAISDSNGLTNATFTYEWLADDAAISGATGSAYTVVAEDVGKALKVRVSFADDVGNAESLTSAATGAVAASAPVVIPDEDEQEEEQTSPLTATTHGVPESHDGSTSFTFELHFSEEFSISYKTLRDHAFTVTGGEVVKARRLEKGKNVRWEITVQPDGDGTVTIVLPITTDCETQGAVCTEDRRMLSNRLEVTVAGPSG